ncbi:MAG: conjugal transfer protein TraR [Gammaproteobacteria bacterium]|nr:conjugal transfer protein TraR [Gammaproteobacteria bacterium]
MAKNSQMLDAAFIERKRNELLSLKEDLQKVTNAALAEEDGATAESNSGARDYEDDAQKLDTLDREGALVNRSVLRLAQIERALQKIADGTYGISDVSGQRIPVDRLEATPEATNTVAEQESSEKAGGS